MDAFRTSVGLRGNVNEQLLLLLCGLSLSLPLLCIDNSLALEVLINLALSDIDLRLALEISSVGSPNIQRTLQRRPLSG